MLTGWEIFGCFLLGLSCGIAGMLAMIGPKSREEMRAHGQEIRNAYVRGHAAGKKEGESQILAAGRFTSALRR